MESNIEDLFDLRIAPIVQTLWNELGLDETQKKMEIDSLSDKIQAIYSDFIAKLMTKCQEIRSEIQKIHSKHRQAMKAFGRPEITLHKLRHSCCSMLIEKGWNIKQL